MFLTCSSNQSSFFFGHVFHIVPANGIRTKYFRSSNARRWLQQNVSPPRDLNSFTLSFWLQYGYFPTSHDYHVACYGLNGQCAVSVTFKRDMKLAIKVSSTE